MDEQVIDFLQWDGQSYSDAEFSEAGSSVKSEQDIFFDLNQTYSAPWEPSQKFNEDHRLSQQILRDSIFGRTHTAEGSAPPPPPEDYTHALAGPHPFKFELHLGDLPVRSRVETQIKCSIFLSPPPEESLLHLPADTIARPRFQLRDETPQNPHTLYLEVDAVLPDAPDKRIYMCSKCICREKKRAFRKKTLDLNEEYHWNETQARRLVIFNCRELMAIPLPKMTRLPDGTSAMARQIDLPLRLACYCRHHGAKSGYRLVFTVRDWQHNIVARNVSDDIFITDNHKEIRATDQSSGSELSTGEAIRRVPQTSFTSPYDRGFRRSSSVSSRSSMGGSISGGMGGVSGGVPSVAPQVQAQVPVSVPPTPPQAAAPLVQRAIPAQGSVRGGVEVTLLGTGFHAGLTAVFGENAAISTQCWSDNTIIAHLPPSNVAGPVVVSFSGIPPHQNSAIFTYTNDSEVKLVELALQVVGFKMNGKIEDATDVASRIVNQEYSGGGFSSGFASPAGGGPQDSQKVVLQCLQYLNRSSGFTNMNLRNSEGQTMMHLAAILGWLDVLVALISLGAHVDIQDVSGFTPLHFATLFGNRAITRALLNSHADPFHRNFGGTTAIDVADSSIADLLPKDQRQYYQLLNTNSSSTLASVFDSEAESEPEADKLATLSSHRAAVRDAQTPSAPQREEQIANPWLQFLSRVLHLGREEPPSYVEIYPHRRASDKQARRAVIEISHSESESEEEEAEPALMSGEHSSYDEEEQSDSEVIQSWASGPLKQIRNDHMLFTFWLPLFIIAVSYIVSLVVNLGDLLQWRWWGALNRNIQRFTHTVR